MDRNNVNEIKNILENKGLDRKEMINLLDNIKEEIVNSVNRKIKFNIQTENYNEVSSTMLDFKDEKIKLVTPRGLIFENDFGELVYKVDGYEDSIVCDVNDIELISYIIDTGTYIVIGKEAENHLG
ncbi:hypothetical protein ACTFIN_07655 [Clostridium cagae]|uniref:hypothetical protein n=1 Tax=Clostridium cagae TaxID=2080751 RepID=UPI003F77715A